MNATKTLTVPYSRHFLEWLNEQQVSLAVTTYQTNRLCLIGVQPNGDISTPVWEFDRPMGLHATADRLYLATRYQIWRLENVLENGELLQNKYDRLYVPRNAHTTGDLDVHDLVADPQGNVIFANTEYSCLATLHPQHSFAPVWKPDFISKLAPEDRCHLNGLAAVNGVPRYVTAISRSDVASGWRHRRTDGGVVIDIQTNEILAGGLSMPHSPRWYQGKLWLINSGTGDFGYIENGEFVPVTFCPGYGRGLAFAGDFAVIGLSKPRDYHFSDLLLGERLKQKEANARCGVIIIDIKTGDIVEWLDLDTEATELYDVAVLPGVRCPMSLGFKTGNISKMVTFAKDLESPNLTAAKGHFERGQTLKKEGKLSEAIACFQRAIETAPDYIPAYNNLGTLLQKQGRLEEAARCYETALKLNPNLAQTLTNLGSIYLLKGRLNEAEERLNRALKLQPEFVPALYNLGLVYKEQARLDEAIAMFQATAKQQRDHADAYFQLGSIWEFQSQFTLAKLAYERAQKLNPNAKHLLPHLTFIKINLCDWENYETLTKQLIDSTGKYIREEPGSSTLAPFHLNAVPLPPEFSLGIAQKHAAGLRKSPEKIPPLAHVKKTDKLRVGYVSPDFHHHAVGRLISHLFERHNREQFEIFGYHLLNHRDEVTEKIESGCDEFYNISQLSAAEAAQKINGDGVDILIDLAGYTGYGKPEIFAHKPAPVQASYLGYPNTLGADFMPYLIADNWVVPPELSQFYSEEIIRLPHQFVCSPMEISNKPLSRGEMGLPEAGFVFACFNRHYKITPDLFGVWMEILRQVEGSVLWLSLAVEETVENLRQTANRMGVASERLIFAPKSPHPEYLARLQLADLALDTWIYNGGSTTIAALYAGLPVLTLPGVTNASRMGASVCASAAMTELICRDAEEYRQQAVHLATHPEELRQLKGRLKTRQAPLFDVSGFAAQLEAAFQQMWNR